MGHHTERDEGFDARYEAYFNRPDIDRWEVCKTGMDLIPDSKVIKN